jgi:hypothetical protein
MKIYNMIQCEMKKGETTTTSWIPEKFVKLGNFVKLKDENNEWVDGWKITFVGSKMSYDNCNKNSQDHKSMATFHTK